MRIEDKMFGLGGSCVGGMFVAADALHWFITPAVDAASGARMSAVAAQAVIGLAVAIYAFTRARRERRGADSHSSTA